MTWKDIPRNPSRSTLRQFAILWLLFFGALGCWKLWHGSQAWGIGLLVLAGSGGGVGVLWPTALRPIFVGWMMAVFPIGWLVSHTLLALLFFVIFTPVALIFRLCGRDALHRRRPAGPSYWQVKPAASGAASYYRQF